MKNYPYLENLIDLIYEKHQNLLPFLDVLRKDISKLDFNHSDSVETANISLCNNRFIIEVNTDFIEEEKLDNEDILWLICHEISHFVLGHLNMEYSKKYTPQLCNIAFDCQVNSMLYNINFRNEIKLFSKVNWYNYKQFLKSNDTDHLIFLTVPPKITNKKVKSDFNKSTYDKSKLDLIEEFWFSNFSESGLGLDEIFRYLEEIIPEEQEQQTEEIDKGFPITEKIEIEDLPKYAKRLIYNQNKDLSEVVNDYTEVSESEQIFKRDFNLNNVEVKQRKQITLVKAIKKSLFGGTTRNILASEKTQFSSVFPSLGRREAAILSNGMLPAFYSHKIEVPIKKSLAVYIDFSGSTKEYHKEICKLLTSIKDFYNGRYFAFSMKVAEITFDDLLNGNFETSGTYITPVVSHIIENNLKKVLIITDGDFYLPNGKSNAEIYAILLDKGNSTSAIEKMGRLKEHWFLGE